MKCKKLVLVLTAILVFSLLLATPVAAAVGFQKYAGNPVMDGTASWEQAAWGVGNSCVYFDSSINLYKMWYSGLDSNGSLALGYAWSTDGLVWHKTVTPVLSKGAFGSWDGYGVTAPCVIKDGSIYRMWYTGIDSNLNTFYQIGYAFSLDGGTTWIRGGNNPVLAIGASGAWDHDGVYSPSVIKEGLTYKMWYSGRTGGHQWPPYLGDTASIGYAESTSTDGDMNWNKLNSGLPVLLASPSSWDPRGVNACTVVKRASNTYDMYYTGFNFGGVVEDRIGKAFSTDGLVWVKSGSVVLDVGPNPWDSYGVSDPSVIIQNNTTKMWYTGSANPSGGLVVNKMGYAEETVEVLPSSNLLTIGLTIGGLAVLMIFSLVIWRSRGYQFSKR
jgi:predicted GH43/DUF377 family glycosyl hydrolase